MSSVARVELTAKLIEAFAGTFLSPLYDNPQPTPQLHRDCWELYCSPVELAGVAAPREHAKSTALTHDYGLATVLFRAQDYIVIVSATEELAMGHLADIAKELRENDDLIREFKIKGLVTDSKSDIIVAFQDGHQARFIAKGAGQKMRGMKWNGKRPGLIICDDLEEDEQVENYDRRKKFRRWFYRALLPCRRRGGLVRMHGTILHEDALLTRLLRATTWSTKLFRAHRGFDEFDEILWPEQFPESRLRAIRQAFIDDGDAAGYSQEYLNDPFDHSEAYLRKADFLPMAEADHKASKLYNIGVDFAVSKADRANRTSFTVGGETLGGTLCIVDQHVGRWDPTEWIDKMFELDLRWKPEQFIVEGGVIWKALEQTIYQEMRERKHYLGFLVINPVKDKATRGRPYQKQHRAGNIKFDKDADWYPAYEAENLRFTGTGDALADDQFDSTAILVKGFEVSGEVEEDDFLEEEELMMRRNDPRVNDGRSAVTGY
jgi:predicted phage terminase large subunit-like protein